MSFVVPSEPTHPVFRLPSDKDFRRIVSEYGESAWNAAMTARNERIRQEKADPFAHGVELPAWLLADWMLGRISWEDFCNSKKCPDTCRVPEEWKCDELRKEFENGPVDMLLVLGGTGSTKTEYMIKRVVQDARENPGHESWVFHESRDNSINYHQTVAYKYLPKSWQQIGKGQQGYVSYKMKTGFSESSFVGANRSRMTFRSYEQDKKTIESGKLGAPAGNRTIGLVADELCPLDWMETLRGRLASRNACGLFGFTPLQGYSPMVKWFRDGAKIVLWTLERDIAQPRKVPVVEVKTIRQKNHKPMKLGIVYFHSRLSPYANYEGLKRLYASDSDEVKLIRYDGYCEAEKQNLFPRLSRKVHSFKLENLPEGGTDYFVTDPCGSNRNWFMGWCRVDPYGRKWVYREWPCRNIPVPRIGRPAPWAKEGQSDAHKKGGIPDMGSKDFGFSLRDYKEEIMRLEKWRDYESGVSVEECSETNGAAEEIYMRFMDSRFAAVKHYSADGDNTSLADECAKINLFFQPTSGREIAVGIKLINDALAYKPNWQTPEDGPRLFICEDCENIWFALENYTGEGGQKEATKDPIDVLRYMETADLEYMGDGEVFKSRLERGHEDLNDKDSYYEAEERGRL